MLVLNFLLIVLLSVFIFLFVDRNNKLKNIMQALNRDVDKGTHDPVLGKLMEIPDGKDNKELFDSLTNLPNHQLFQSKLKQIDEYSKNHQQIYSVMLINIDEFSHINQALGYDFGDKLLLVVSKRLKSLMRQIDMIARYAGDNFAILLPQLSQPDVALFVAQRIQDGITQPFVIEDQKIFLTASIGICVSSLTTPDIEKVMAYAKEALHKAKISGKNTYRMARNQDESLTEKEMSVSDYLESANLVNKLVMYYDSYYDVEKNKKAYISLNPHLNYADLKNIPFSDFFRAAEDAGRMAEITEWQFRESLSKFKTWQGYQLNLEKLIITIPLKQIESANFIYNVSQLLNESKISAHQIIFEIAECDVMTSDQELKKALVIAHQLGVKILMSAITLGRLVLHKVSDLPIHYLKIDSKLVRDLLQNSESESIIRTMIEISKDSNIEVLSEGVDNENQKNKLLELGCHLFKGRLFSSSKLAEEMTEDVRV